MPAGTPPQPGCSETPADDSIRVTVTVPAGWEVDPLRLGVWLTAKNSPARRGEPVRRTWRVAVPGSLSWVSDDGHPGRAVRRRLRQRDREQSVARRDDARARHPGGYAGKYLDLQIPADISACTDGYFPWEPGIYAQRPQPALARLDPRCQRDPRRDPDHRLRRDVGGRPDCGPGDGEFDPDPTLSQPRVGQLRLLGPARPAQTTRRSSSLRAITSRWTWLVPSPISVSFASRR